MNKKKLSVVMAGAMLATSVAPVLAAETTAKEYTVSQKKLLAKEIETLMKSKMVSTNGALLVNKASERFVKTQVADLMVADASAYGVAVVDVDGTEGAISYDVSDVKSTIEGVGLTAGKSIKVYERKTNEFYGENIPGSAVTVGDASVGKYTETDLSTDGTNVATALDNEIKLVDSGDKSKLVKSTKYDSKNKEVKITLNALDENNNEKVITLKVGDEKLDFQLALDKADKLVDTTIDTTSAEAQIQNFDHFAKKITSYIPSQTTTEKSEYATYKVVADKNENEILNASDLYDGLALTARGTEILADLKNAVERVDDPTVTITNPGTPGTDPYALVQMANTTIGSADANGYYKFTVNYYKAKESTAYKTITVRTTNKKEIESLIKLMQTGEFKVGIVAGDNRYATAVNVAKTSNVKLAATASTTETSNIILVNGGSLVDGLAAAPLAATINGTSNISAPVLLSKADSLPEETKDYLKELSSTLAPKALKNIKVTLVGGRTVLNNSVVEELEDMGFTVERVGGANREETSVEVAKSMKLSGNKNSAFVVGANGEADAMSIAAVASIEGKETPIIVAKAGGISSDALGYIEDFHADGNVKIIGGEAVFSKEDENKVNDALVKTNGAYRIAGSNRKETNTEIIKTYYGTGANATGVVLVKDGQGDTSKLIDALSAANYAAAKNAPIVLATSSISEGQKNALLNVNGTIASVTQVGEGVERSILESVAKLLGVSNK